MLIASLAELNIFDGIFKNYIYLVVMLIEIILQILIIQFGGKGACFHLFLSLFITC